MISYFLTRNETIEFVHDDDTDIARLAMACRFCHLASICCYGLTIGMHLNRSEEDAEPINFLWAEEEAVGF